MSEREVISSIRFDQEYAGQSRVAQIVILGDPDHALARKYAEQIRLSHRWVVEMVFRAGPVLRRRHFYFTGRKWMRLAGGTMFCLQCNSPRSAEECYWQLSQTSHTCERYCRTCRYSVPYAFELTPGIEKDLEFDTGPGYVERREFFEKLHLRKAA